ncbi:MAG: pyrrolysine--tRNA(Pyl) ligase large subunit [Bacillota bacterium]|nr:pyrrolysine--tRNA(Pyl) ligase large subunit [Bacillota bacterium]
MKTFDWTDIQKQRLQELGAAEADFTLHFRSAEERNSRYQEIETELVRRGKEQLLDYRDHIRRPAILQLEHCLVDVLTEKGFSQVTTPLLLSKGLLAKMTITEEHPLFRQVFWIDSKRCLRPMLAPNLYYVLKDLLRIWPHPVSIFEIGPCFRKDSQGGSHMQEFTMLNLVEMGLPEADRQKRIRELAQLVMNAAGIENYSLETESSDVYKETIDVLCGDLELGSGAMGPHELDLQWGIDVPWVGIGFGLERLVMVRQGHNNIQKSGRSLTYLNGIRLNLK